MRIALIGAGRLASSLAPALQRGGADIIQVWSRTEAAATALASALHCEAAWGSVENVMRDADLYLLAVKDAVLPEMICRLHVGREKSLMAHTAGSMPLSLFADAGHERSGVFYPMQTFTKGRAVDFSRVHFFIEASQPEDSMSLTRLAWTLNGNESFVHPSTSASRRQLHLAAVFACNFVNHCCTLADDALSDAGLDFSVLLPLVDETVAKLHQMPPVKAQTGPAVRRDDNVMGIHRSMLVGKPDVQKIYSLLSQSIQRYDKL